MQQKKATVLKQHSLDDMEFCILASLSGLVSCDLALLGYYTLLSETELKQAVERMQERGLLAADASQISLTDTGYDKLAPLLAATRANEAEALGTFSAQEVLTLKSSLRRIIAWTSDVPAGNYEQQQSLRIGKKFLS